MFDKWKSFAAESMPTKRSIIRFATADGDPGINQSALEVIREKSISYEVEKGHQLHLTLISDEMSIHRNFMWNKSKKDFEGGSSKINTSQIDDSELLKTAKDALVFLAVGPDFKIPVAYCLLSGLEAVDRASITLQVIKSIEECGVRVMSLTSDGLKANLKTAEKLGAEIENDKTYFDSTTYPGQRIYVIFDPPHMLKLIRKHFSSGKLHSSDGHLDWKFLESLVARQTTENFNMCNQLTKKHINWGLMPMNVKLAAQTLSRSVADALEQCEEDGYEEFENTGATVEFIRNINDLFDLFNFAQKSLSDGKYRQPIMNETVGIIFPFLSRMKTYLKDIKLEKKPRNKQQHASYIPAFESQVSMGFRGFYINIISLIGIYEDFVRDGPLEKFYTMQFGQDHLETLFSLIRSSQGGNDNPNVMEFKSAFRKLLVCHPLSTCRDPKPITNATGILTVTTLPVRNIETQLEESLQTEMITVDYDELLNSEMESMESFHHHLFAYVASCVETRIKRDIKAAKKTKCMECAGIFDNENVKIFDDFLAKKNANEYPQPCESTYQIVVFTNAIMKSIPSNGNKFKGIKATICQNLDVNQLYCQSTFVHQNQDHKYDFVKEVVETYMVLKSEKIIRLIAEEDRGESKRNRLKKAIHLAGQ